MPSIDPTMSIRPSPPPVADASRLTGDPRADRGLTGDALRERDDPPRTDLVDLAELGPSDRPLSAESGSRCGESQKPLRLAFAGDPIVGQQRRRRSTKRFSTRWTAADGQ